MKKLKSRDEWLNEGHSYDKEIEKARMMQGSAAELVQWAERKIAESRPENFKEGVISPVQEKSVNEEGLVRPINDKKMKPITKKHWDKADDKQKEEWLLQAFSDPDDAMEYIEVDWNDLPPEATSNMYENVNEASRWKGKEIYPNWVKPNDIEGFVKKESDLEVGRDYVLYEPGMDSWQAEYTYKGKIKGEYTFTSSSQFSTSPDEKFTRKELDAMIKDLELAVMESINENVKDAAFNLDKIFPEDAESIILFQDIEDHGTVKDMIEYINVHGNEEMLSRYGIRNDRDVKKLAKHIMKESVKEADDNWSDDVKTKWTPPKGLFAETTPPNKIADTLFKASKDLDQAMSRLMFYINRAGKLLSPKAKANLEVAKKMLQKKYA